MKWSVPIVGLLLLVMPQPSCKEVILFRYGIRQPRKESLESLQQFLARHRIPNENVFLFRDSSAFVTYLRDPVCRQHLFHPVFYSTRGLLHPVRDSSGCLVTGCGLARYLKPDTLYPCDTTHRISGILELLTALGEYTCLDTSGGDYFIVASWAAFLGKYNNRVFRIRTAARENEEVRIIPLFVSVDMLAEWHLTDGQRLVFRDD